MLFFFCRVYYIRMFLYNGILAVKDVLETRSNKEPKTWILPCSLYFVLTKTCFKLYDRFCEQISGIAMGTKCALSYAITFMDEFEQEFLTRYPLSHMVWWRYIDDVFMICSREELYFFINGLNNSHSTLRFTSDESETTVNFLDVRITKDASGRIQTSLYSKPTDAHLYSTACEDETTETAPVTTTPRIYGIFTWTL